jgi:hypothetical protein
MVREGFGIGKNKRKKARKRENVKMQNGDN